MTVKELIDFLEGVENKDSDVLFAPNDWTEYSVDDLIITKEAVTLICF